MKAGTVQHSNNLCAYSLRAGEVERADLSCQQSLLLREKMADKDALARTLANWGDVKRARGDLAAAKQSYEKGLAIMEGLGKKGDAAQSRVGLATLALDQNRTADAKKLAGTAMTELIAEKDIDGEADCRARRPLGTPRPSQISTTSSRRRY